MSFQRPAIHVFQELVSTNTAATTPYFELCLVGPSYQVVKEAKGASYDAGTAYTSTYVDKALGTVVDQASLALTFKNAYAKMWPTGASMTNAVTVDNTGAVTKIAVPLADQETKKFSTANVAVGDIVKISYTVAEVTTNYTSYVQAVEEDGITITLKRNLPAPDTATIAATIERALPSSISPANSLFTIDEDGITETAAASVTATVSGSSRVIMSADVYFSYKALRSYLSSDFVQIEGSSDVLANLGAADPENPLALASSIVLSNAGISFKVLQVATDDNSGYLAALDILSTNEKVYVIVPLTQDKDVISAYASHCATQSMPAKSRWRIMYANMVMPATKVVVELNEGVLAAGVVAQGNTPATNYVKDIANGLFVTNNVVANDFIDFYSGTTYQYSLLVKDIHNDTVAEVYTNKYVKGTEGYSLEDPAATKVAAVDETLNYEVCRVLSAAGIAEEMVIIAQSFGNKRLRLVQPDTIMININGIDYIMPGYYLAAAYGALRASQPPHQGFTTLSISGIKRLYRSNKYFKDTQLDEMAGGGVFWVVQDDVDSLPYCIYQTTTDTTQLETSEDSIVATIDYCSKYYKTELKPVIGKFNVNTISAKYVSTVINTITDKLKRETYPYIGPVLISGTLKSMETSADKIIPTVTIQVPFPVNAVDLYLEV